MFIAQYELVAGTQSIDQKNLIFFKNLIETSF